MSPQPESIDLGPEDEARRLWKGALAARERSADDLVALFEWLDLGVRAAEILVLHKLQPFRDRFPATIGIQLETPSPEIDVIRDAVTVPKALQFTDMLDLLSADGLECVGPRLHRGWEDRRFACKRSRDTAREALGVALDEPARDHLLLLSAYRNRIFRYPPPIRVRPVPIQEAFGTLKQLVEPLL